LILEWNESLDIGVSVIDAEHRYLVSLINNLHDRAHDPRADRDLGSLFAHLLRYTEVHFRNEEALMQSCAYPALVQHKAQHEALIESLETLSEAFLNGSDHDRARVMEFLRRWLIDHVSRDDRHIGTFLRNSPGPSTEGFAPAFRCHKDGKFKVCSHCDRSWDSFESLAADEHIQVLEPMIDRNNHYFNLLLFNCGCGTTLALQLSELSSIDALPFALEEPGDHGAAPAYCLNGTQCLERCACKFTQTALACLRNDTWADHSEPSAALDRQESPGGHRTAPQS